MPRLVTLGCGTGVGKTHVSRALLAALGRAGQPCVGLKPIETGIPDATHSPNSDAATLSRASTVHLQAKHPLYAFAEPISPHLAARREGVEIELAAVAAWVA